MCIWRQVLLQKLAQERAKPKAAAAAGAVQIMTAEAPQGLRDGAVANMAAL
jgi:hypothetical protein